MKLIGDLRPNSRKLKIKKSCPGGAYSNFWKSEVQPGKIVAFKKSVYNFTCDYVLKFRRLLLERFFRTTSNIFTNHEEDVLPKELIKIR